MRLRERIAVAASALKPWSQELQWAAIGLLGAVALVLGYIGIHSYLSAEGAASPWWTVLYHDLQLFALEQGPFEGAVPWQLDVARIAVPAVTVLAAVKGATLLLRDNWLLLRARMARDHLIVCGLGRRGLRLSRSLLERGERVVVVELDAENDRIGAAQRAGAGTVIGDASDPEVLRRAGIGRAGRLISVCGEDGIDASVAAAAREQAKGRRRGHSLACMAHIFDQALCELIRSEQVAAAETIPFRLDIFNMFEEGARVMLADHPIRVNRDWERPIVVVAGVGWLGASLVTAIARSWREDGLERHGRLSITLVDRDAEARRRSLLLRQPWIEEVCELRPAALTVGLPEFESGEFLDDELRRSPPDGGVLAYVCLDDTNLALDAALALRKRTGGKARIVVRTDTDEGLGSLLGRRPGDDAPGIVPFPFIDRACDAESVIRFTFTERLARAIHTAYLERASHDSSDPSMQQWEALDEELRESNRDAARGVGRKLSETGCDVFPLSEREPPEFRFSSEEIDALAEVEHRRWVDDRRRNGWKLGARRDLDAKLSPYLVPFDQLPPEIQDYDRDAVRNLPRVLADAGYGIARGSDRPRGA